MATGWIRAQVFFASMYSYRIPNTSPSFAPTSPVPSPSAVRLALVDAAIQESGSVGNGQTVFELVKSVPLFLVPPKRVCIVKAFTKRLKPGKGKVKELVESTGIREYCHPDGPLEIYLEMGREAKHILRLFQLLRRLGTTDSLAFCSAEIGGEPPAELSCRPMDCLPIEPKNFRQRMVVSLLELPEDANFKDVNPYAASRRGFTYRQQFWMTSLVQRQRGENWALYERVPFNLGDSQ